MTGSVTNVYSKTFKCFCNVSLLTALRINGPNSAAVGAALLSHIIRDAYSERQVARGKYEGWNFNSGNYLFKTDTK